ncbi:MAG: hypothetical protein HeimC3_54560 [Candidatus Heimdallarchaeota archaeon LC_3]|nr:MAG: hypothetical protein HeimC3_54560 [Candidatus Heimdallarchaeota archaeon LC_3]
MKNNSNGEKDNFNIEKEFLITFNMDEKKTNSFSSEMILGTYESENAPFTLKLIGLNNKSHILMFLISGVLILIFSIIVEFDILTTNSRAKDILFMTSFFIMILIIYFFLKPYYIIFRNKQMKNGMFLEYSFGFSTQDITRDKELLCSIGDLELKKVDKLKKRRVMNNLLQLTDSIDCMIKIPGFNELVFWRLRFTQWLSFPKITKIIIYPKIKKNNNNYSFN